MVPTNVPNVTDWLASVGAVVAALGTVGTLVAALWQINTEREARQRLERQVEQRERRAQAERISAWPASRAPAAALGQSSDIDEEVGPTWIELLNRSEEPVYWAIASLVLIQGAGQLLPTTGREARLEYRATLSLIPPGRHYISVAPFGPAMS